MRWLASALALSLAALASAGATASPSGVARAPQLTFVAQRSDEAPWRLCLARADGTRRLRVSATMSRAAWSPDAKRFAAVRSRSRPSRGDLVVADARGRVVRRLASAGEYPHPDPAWSPDGRLVAMSGGGRGGAIWVVPARGGAPRWLALSRTLSISFDSPTWAPDARSLAFSVASHGVPPGVDYPSGVYTVDVAGGEPRLLVPNAQMPAYSPDGSKLAYVLGGDVVVANADGTNPRAVTETAAREDRPAWSPDGRRLAFSRLAGSRLVVVVARGDGSGTRVAVSSPRFHAFLPSWRPRGVSSPARRRPCADK